jgi:hypothetical protein
MKKLTLFMRRVMGHMSRCGLMWVASLVILAVAQTASAIPIAIPLSDFVIFSGGGLLAPDGGNETEIGGHTVINGNIGSNQDLSLQGNPILPDYPAELNGSAT